MTNATGPLEMLFEKAENYGIATLALYKLRAIENTADIASSLLSRLTVILSIVLSVVIINIGFALWIGELLANWSYGFFIVGIFYGVAAAIVNIFRNRWVKLPISNLIIKHLLKQKP